MSATMIEVRGLRKSFTLHLQGGVHIPVLDDVHLTVHAGECVALTGASGSGKSTLLRCLYGNYAAGEGSIRIRHRGRWVEMAEAAPRTVLAVRRETLGYVSQFLRVVPRVSTLDLVAEPVLATGADGDSARARAASLLERLRIPERLWELPPATFSGGEQQRVNIARGLAADHDVLLLDEPTASLDADNGRIVMELIREACDRGKAVVGIFHDEDVRRRLCDREYEIVNPRRAA